MNSTNSDNSRSTYSFLMHDTINHVSTIMSIAQFGLISKEMSPEVKDDLQRIVDTVRQVSVNLRQIAEILEDEED